MTSALPKNHAAKQPANSASTPGKEKLIEINAKSCTRGDFKGGGGGGVKPPTEDFSEPNPGEGGRRQPDRIREENGFA